MTDNVKFNLIKIGALSERLNLRISITDDGNKQEYYIQGSDGLVVDKYYSLDELIAFMKGCEYVHNNNKR